MAEAHLAVDPRPGLTQQSFMMVDPSLKRVQVNLSKEGFMLYVPKPYYLVRNARRHIWHSVVKIQQAFMPFPLKLVVATMLGVTVWVTTRPSGQGIRNSRVAHWVWKWDSLFPYTKYFPVNVRVAYQAFNVTTAGLLAITSVNRFLLRQLLSYHGWLEEHRGKKSLKTQLWGALLKYVFIRRPVKNLCAYQSALPALPLPELKRTCDKLLETLKPLTTPSELAELEKMKTEFLQNEGPKLQGWLVWKHRLSTCYVEDWWLKYVYLASRESIAINSNWYGCSFSFWRPTRNQAARAACMTYNFFKNKVLIEQENFDPFLINGMVPMCMDQYEHVFSTRIPGMEQDSIIDVDPDESRHVAVFHKGRVYKLPLTMGRRLTPLELYRAYVGIIEAGEKDQTAPPEALLPALTALNRTKWAEIRENRFLRDPINREALKVIESAAFCVSLLGDDYPDVPNQWSEEGRRYLTGPTGAEIWFDKSMNLVVHKDGRAGINAEHGWGDAPVLAHLVEINCGYERTMYEEDGTPKPKAIEKERLLNNKLKLAPAERLLFKVNSTLKRDVEEAHHEFQGRIDNLDLKIMCFDQYGKGAVKKFKCSPDAWIQMALQVAFFRDQGEFCQTYESSMTRLFAHGRTETIRSCSELSCAFVRAFEKRDVPVAEKIKLLQEACESHQKYSHECMVGKGIDRHLFALYVVSAGKEIDSPFLKAAMKRKWRLSTSQVPQRQCKPGFYPADPDEYYISPSGGFGPVADDGYGVSYAVCDEKRFFFHVSSTKAKGTTSSERMINNIKQALLDMAAMFKDTATAKKN